MLTRRSWSQLSVEAKLRALSAGGWLGSIQEIGQYGEAASKLTGPVMSQGAAEPSQAWQVVR